MKKLFAITSHPKHFLVYVIILFCYLPYSVYFELVVTGTKKIPKCYNNYIGLPQFFDKPFVAVGEIERFAQP